MKTKERFSNRVDSYIKYRPDYPAEVIDFLKDTLILKSDSIIADIGSGTGISSLPFLKENNTVYGIEPNKEMREAAERLLNNYHHFKSINASAEETTLPTESIDLIIAGQAFHWFDKQKCKAEFKRMLKPDGHVILMWNDRRTDSTAFLRDYEDLIKEYATDYLEVNHKNIDESIFNDFFGKDNYFLRSFDNFQYFDLEGLKGRILSSSYMPAPGEKNFEEMMKALEDLFEKYNDGGKVTIEYDTLIYYGKLN
jgi:ubiquinone/menaquinone biosynthesis C-methylase UbiE